MDKTLPLIKFPTLLIVVDDNKNFLTNFALGIKPFFKCKIFNTANEALKFIQDQDELLRNLIQKIFPVYLEDVLEVDKKVVNFDVNKIHHISYDKNRFNLSTIMVTDYAMPEKDGLILAKNSKNYLIKIIMLTGEAGFDIAVSGFNVKSIDQFVLKSDPDYLEKIVEVAKDLENSVFKEISYPLINAISGKLNSIYNDSIFIDFFDQFIKDKNIVEFYLVESSGSYLMLNSEGKVYWLIVKNEEDMRMLFELARDDQEVPVSIIDDLKNKKKVVYFPSEREQLLSAKFWPLLDAHCIKGSNGTYYYGVFEGADDYYRLKKNDISSYKDYLEN